MSKKQIIIIPNDPCISNVALLGTQSIANNTWVQINYTDVIYEEGSTFDLTLNQYIIPASGYYSVFINTHFASSAVAHAMGTELRVNGVTVQSFIFANLLLVNHDGNVPLFRQDYFNVGDILTSWAFQNSGAARNLNTVVGMYPSFGIYKTYES